MARAQLSPPYRDPEAFSVSSQGHALTFYPGGSDRLDALIELIEAAQNSLQLFFYMFQADGSGKAVRDALVAAAKRGVKVELMIDRFGSDAPKRFFNPLVSAGGRFASFNPRWSVRYLVRNHQKMLIADQRVALVGGFNIEDSYFDPPEKNGWCDLAVSIEGPVVSELVSWFGGLAEWTEGDGSQYRAVRTMVREWQPGEGPVQMLVGGPTLVPSNWARRLRRDLIPAERLDLVMAYFSPPQAFRRLIRRIGTRGKARLITAGRSDNGATIAASRSLYSAMLYAGCEIHEFEACKQHMKLIVIDDVVYFGSANLDHRSVRINLELMFRFKDAALAERMRKLMDVLETGSRRITPELYRKRRTLFSQIKGWVGWFLVSTLDYTVSRGFNLKP